MRSSIDCFPPRLPADGELRQLASLDALPDSWIIYAKTDPPSRKPQVDPNGVLLLFREHHGLDQPAHAHPLVHVALLTAVEREVVGRLLQLVLRDDVVLLVHNILATDRADRRPAEHELLIFDGLPDVK